MKRKIKVDYGPCSSTQGNYDAVTGLRSRQPGHAWQFADDVDRLLGGHAEPDPLFFVESWTIGVPRAIHNWQQRGQEKADSGRQSSILREPDSVGAGSFVVDRPFDEEYVYSVRADANTGGCVSGSSLQSDEDCAIRTEDIVLQDWNAHAEESNSDHGTTLTMTKLYACHVLGVTANCTRKEIKAAYRRKVIQWHPDRLGGMTEEVCRRATEEMAAINEAYRLLRIGLL